MSPYAQLYTIPNERKVIGINYLSPATVLILLDFETFRLILEGHIHPRDSEDSFPLFELKYSQAIHLGNRGELFIDLSSLLGLMSGFSIPVSSLLNLIDAYLKRHV